MVTNLTATSKAPARPSIQIEIRNHPASPAHKIVKAVSRGRVYAVATAEPFPSIEEAQQWWKDDRKAFRPFDETTGRYLGGRQS